ncbi:MAG: hypothetical protein J6R22_04755 [Alphaproteobacteria bacterium]|nr:hypothetical protein [Alphaproteobacteria bacterium]
MKKMTAGIFAGILGMVSMGAADANVASTGWVNQQLGAKADQQTVATLQQDVETLDAVVELLKGAVYDTEGNPIDVEQLKAALEGDIEDLQEKFVDAQGNEIDLKALQASIKSVDDKIGDMSGYVSQEGLGTLTKAIDALNTRVETIAGGEISADKLGDKSVTLEKLGVDVVEKYVDTTELEGALANYYTKEETMTGAEVANAIAAAKLKSAGDESHAFYIDANGVVHTIEKVAAATHADTADSATTAASADEAAKATSADYATKAGEADAAAYADEAGSAEKDAAGNVITTTYATKTEITNAGYQDAGQVQTAIGEATKDMATDAEVETAISNAVTAEDGVIGQALAGKVDTTTLTEYQGTVTEALADKQDKLNAAGSTDTPVYIGTDGQPVAVTEVAKATTASDYASGGTIESGLESKVDIPSLTASDAAYGKYVLTADKTEAGATYYWEQIERAVVDGVEQF